MSTCAPWASSRRTSGSASALAQAQRPPRLGRPLLLEELLSSVRLAGRSVPGDGLGGLLTVDGRGGVVGRGGDGVETNQAFDRLLAQHVLAIELRHLRVFGVFLDLVGRRSSAGAKLFFASVLGDA